MGTDSSNLDPIQEIEPKVEGGRSFGRLVLVDVSFVPRHLKIEGSAWYTLFANVRSLLGNLHTIRYTNHALTKQSISVYLLISHSYALCEVHSGGFKVKNAIALTAQLVSSHSGQSMNFKGIVTSFKWHSAYLQWTNR